LVERRIVGDIPAPVLLFDEPFDLLAKNSGFDIILKISAGFSKFVQPIVCFTHFQISRLLKARRKRLGLAALFPAAALPV
jgi:hypothetical protein